MQKLIGLHAGAAVITAAAYKWMTGGDAVLKGENGCGRT